MKKYVFKIRKIDIVVYAIIIIIIAVAVCLMTIENNRYENIARRVNSELNSEDAMDNIMKITEACKDDNIGKSISVVGFMGGTMADDGTMAWIVEKPFMSSGQFLNGSESIICIEPKEGNTFEYNELAIVATGTLRANRENNSWYLVNTEIEEYAVDSVDRLVMFNMLISNGYADVIESLAQNVYDTVNFDEMKEYASSSIETSEIERTINTVREYCDFEYANTACIILESLKSLVDDINKIDSASTMKNKREELNNRAKEIYAEFYSHITEAGKDIIY